MPQLLIIDGHSFAYRAFYAIRKLNAPDGKPTNAIYGFIRMLGKVKALVKPTHMVVIWDGGLAAERMALLPEYKAQRKEMPAELGEQLDSIVSYLRAIKVSSWMKEGVEADDCIAAITRQAVQGGIRVVIASSDKDFMQLVSDSTQLLGPSGTLESMLDVEGVIKKTGVTPGQVIDWLSLVGDAVDNIPGVKGVGPKTASNLLKQFDSIDELYLRLSEVTSAQLKLNLESAKELVRRNQKLVALNEQVPCGLTLEELALQNADKELLSRMFDQWGFHFMKRELERDQLKTGDFFNE